MGLKCIGVLFVHFMRRMAYVLNNSWLCNELIEYGNEKLRNAHEQYACYTFRPPFGHLQGGALQWMDKSRYYKTYEPMHTCEIPCFSNIM